MRLRRLTAEHYRSFERLDLELRPLTLLYGDNSSGKSTLLRLLPLIAGSLSGSGGPLALDGPASSGSSFDELIGAAWRSDDPTFRLGLGWEDGLSVRWNLGNMAGADNRRRPVLLDIWAERGAVHAQAHDPRSDAEPWPGAVPLESLKAERLRPAGGEGLFAELRQRLGELLGRVAYLGPSRAPLLRSLPSPVFEGDRLQADGRDALAALSLDEGVEKEVSDWLRKVCGRSLLRQGNGDHERWTLSPVSRQELAVPLADAGLGLGQLLPELVAIALRAGPGRPRGAHTLCFEEPATHLHERLQVAVGARLAEVAGEAEPVTMIVETHSRPLLTGVQLAIARGLPPERVILHWVEQDAQGQSRVTPVTFDRSGLPVGDRLATTFQAESHALSDLADIALRAWS